MNLPKGWKQVQLGDLITEEQWKPLWEIISTTRDPIERVRKLSQELKKIGPQLEAKDCVPDYLAYWLEHTFGSRQEAKE